MYNSFLLIKVVREIYFDKNGDIQSRPQLTSFEGVGIPEQFLVVRT